MNIKEWEKESAIGVIKQIKKSIDRNGKLLDCWKFYLKSVNKQSLEIMKIIDNKFMNWVLKQI